MKCDLNISNSCLANQALPEGITLGQADGMSPPQRRRAGMVQNSWRV